MNARVITWVLPGLTLAVYAALVTIGVTRLVPEAQGLQPFDLRFGGYTMTEARDYLQALSPRGYALYAGPIWWLDTIFPPLMALTLAWWMRPLAGAFGFVCVTTATVYAGLDWAENFFVQSILNGGPDFLNYGSVIAASTMTQCKFAAVALGLVLAARQSWRRMRA